MAGYISKTQNVYNKWYTREEADEVQDYLIKNELTGNNWEWRDRNGNKIVGSNR